jgi:hypothetical protein
MATLTIWCHVGPTEGDLSRHTSAYSRGSDDRSPEQPIGNLAIAGRCKNYKHVPLLEPLLSFGASMDGRPTMLDLLDMLREAWIQGS